MTKTSALSAGSLLICSSLKAPPHRSLSWGESKILVPCSMGGTPGQRQPCISADIKQGVERVRQSQQHRQGQGSTGQKHAWRGALRELFPVYTLCRELFGRYRGRKPRRVFATGPRWQNFYIYDTVQYDLLHYMLRRRIRAALLSAQIAPQHVVAVPPRISVLAPVVHLPWNQLELDNVMLHVEAHGLLVSDLQVDHQVPIPR